jgi:hypothetical protein
VKEPDQEGGERGKERRKKAAGYFLDHGFAEALSKPHFY